MRPKEWTSEERLAKAAALGVPSVDLWDVLTQAATRYLLGEPWERIARDLEVNASALVDILAGDVVRPSGPLCLLAGGFGARMLDTVGITVALPVDGDPKVAADVARKVTFDTLTALTALKGGQS